MKVESYRWFINNKEVESYEVKDGSSTRIVKEVKSPNEKPTNFDLIFLPEMQFKNFTEFTFLLLCEAPSGPNKFWGFLGFFGWQSLINRKLWF